MANARFEVNQVIYMQKDVMLTVEVTLNSCDTIVNNQMLRVDGEIIRTERR